MTRKKSFAEKELDVLGVSAPSDSPARLDLSASRLATVPSDTPAFAQDEVLIQFAAQDLASARQAGLIKALAAVGGEIAEVIQGSLENAEAPALVRMKVGVPAEKAIEVLAKLAGAGLEFVEHNWIYTTQATSNDSFYSSADLWGMYGPGNPAVGSGTFGSKADEAWLAGFTGSSKTVLGIIDEGVDYRHPDLYLNIWLNQGEIPISIRGSLKDKDDDGLITFRDLNHGDNAAYVTDKNGNGYIDAGDLLNDTRWENGIDEDGNTYRDDLVGWDFVGRDNDPYNSNASNHGTHVAGTIGGMGGNGIGVAGVSWSTQMMLLPFLGSRGGYTSDAVLALNYYNWQSSSSANLSANFFATNNSWGGGGSSTALLNAIVASANTGNLFIAAAGNSGVNTDTNLSYPSTYSTLSAAGYEAVVAVGSIDSAGARSSFSNYGNSTVDLFAPGSGIVSSVAGGTYANYSGTSMATPHVSGALALLASALKQGTLTDKAYAQQLVEILKTSVASMSNLLSISAWDGRLDVAAMMAKVSQAPVDPEPPPADPETITGTSGADTLTGGSGDNHIYGKGGNDVLTGGGGSDRFYFDTQLGPTNIDTITDFQTGVDKIMLSQAVFSKLTLGALAGGSFIAGASVKAADRNDFILFDTGSGGLYFDSDGSGKAAPVQFAQMGVPAQGIAPPQMTAADFWIV